MKAKSFKGKYPEEIKNALVDSMSHGFKPTLAIVFISIKQDRKAVCKILSNEGIDIFGATSCGEFINGHQSNGEIVVLLMDLSRDYYTPLLEDMGGRSIQEVSAQVANSALSKFAFRIQHARKHGQKTMAHFGIPKLIRSGPLEPACILAPEVREKYRRLLTDFMTSFPEVDDVLVYTFDQGAWLCSEFGPCPRCSGLPLDERLPGFLDLLADTMQRCRPGRRLWWKPWELSKGQVVAILGKVTPEHLGLVLNPSTSNEVYPFNERAFKSDLGVKRLVRMAFERSIPGPCGGAHRGVLGDESAAARGRPISPSSSARAAWYEERAATSSARRANRVRWASSTST